MWSPVMERCEDCRKICLCHGECDCLVTTVGDTYEWLLCHECTDKREDEDGAPAHPGDVSGFAGYASNH